jgi:hypothetical protein
MLCANLSLIAFQSASLDEASAAMACSINKARKKELHQFKSIAESNITFLYNSAIAFYFYLGL